MEGADAEHQVQDVAFEQVKVLGKELKESSPNIKIGQQVENVRFVP